MDSGGPNFDGSGLAQFGASVQLARRELSYHLDRYKGNKVAGSAILVRPTNNSLSDR